MDEALELTSRVRQLLAHAYVLGGSPCSGKSTVAAQLAAQFGLDTYKVDDHDAAHMARCRPAQQPVMCRYAAMSWDEIWMRPVPLQIDEEFDFYRERFGLIAQDLVDREPTRPIIVEGAALLPELIHAYGADPARVLFMVPTAAFQWRHYRQRPWISGILAQCADPEQAFANWMARDLGFGQAILRQAQEHGYATMVVDGTRTIAATTADVVIALGL